MEKKYEIFLLVAQENSFTEAAKKYYVTQQAVSYHINALEKELGCILFHRQPNLKLTQSGEVLYENLKKIQMIERNTENIIGEILDEQVGEIKIGINTVRSRILLTHFLEEYTREYPKVKIRFDTSDTRILEKKLENNMVDMFVGVNTMANENFEKLKIFDERLYFIATNKYLKKNLNWTEEKIAESKREGISLLELDRLSMVRSLENCSFCEVINSQVNRLNLVLNDQIMTSDYDMKIHFCGKDLVGAFCPTFVMHEVFQYNKINTDNPIEIFKIKELSEKIRVDLVSFNLIEKPKYQERFINLFLEETKFIYSNIETMLEKYFNS